MNRYKTDRDELGLRPLCVCAGGGWLRDSLSSFGAVRFSSFARFHHRRRGVNCRHETAFEAFFGAVFRMCTRKQRRGENTIEFISRELQRGMMGRSNEASTSIEAEHLGKDIITEI